nr:hypothetical protein [Rhodoferax sp.]
MFYLDLFSAFHRHKVDYVLIGGLAVALHGVERNTMDIDVAVVTSPENLAHLINAASELGLTPMLPVPLSTLADIDQLKRWHIERNLQAFALRAAGMAGVTVDVLLFPPVLPTDMCARAVVFDVSGVPVAVASIDDLVSLKQAVGRPIDLSDIEHLQRIKGSA